MFESTLYEECLLQTNVTTIPLPHYRVPKTSVSDGVRSRKSKKGLQLRPYLSPGIYKVLRFVGRQLIFVTSENKSPF